MDKRSLHHIWKRLKPVSYWYFLIAFLISGFVAISALRQNNLRAIELRNEVNKVDEQNGDIEAALKKLREYVYGHMNSNLAGGDLAIKPPIQLKYRYERLVKAEQERVAAINGNLYSEAQADCERRFPASFFGAGRIPCVQEYVTTHGGVAEQPIPDALYKFDFVSPRWSPDLAGWSLVLSGLFLGLFLLRFGLERWFHAQLD